MSNENIKKVELWEGTTKKPLDSLVGNCIFITLTTGKTIEVELFERLEGMICIRATGSIWVKPRASNVIAVKPE